MRRAGLDYREWARVATWPDMEAFRQQISPPRLFAFSRHAVRGHWDVHYAEDDAFVFGPETRGLPAVILDSVAPDHRLRIPMLPGNRSLNLSNAVAVVCYEAWRQHRFAGAAS